MKRALLASLFTALFALAACGGPAQNNRDSDEPTPITKVPPQDEEEVDGKGKEWGGWRYKGARDDCFFLYKGRCYTTEKKACKAAGCKGKDCRLEGAGPATVSCKKKK